VSEPLSYEAAEAIVKAWKQAHKDELDLVHRKLADTNLALVAMLRRAEKAEARLAELDDRPDC
jgi:FMN-dependent NADH-azoreductase